MTPNVHIHCSDIFTERWHLMPIFTPNQSYPYIPYVCMCVLPAQVPAWCSWYQKDWNLRTYVRTCKSFYQRAVQRFHNLLSWLHNVHCMLHKIWLCDIRTHILQQWSILWHHTPAQRYNKVWFTWVSLQCALGIWTIACKTIVVYKYTSRSVSTLV